MCYNLFMKIMCVSNSNPNFKNNRFANLDYGYKKLLQEGLKNEYGISCKIEQLNPIAGPNEMKSIFAKLKAFQYQVGENFRANFHIHTNASDGRLSVDEYLGLCKDWADKVFKDKKSNDDLPPFSASITDHNRIKSTKEVVAKIAENPDEYKNFKFIAGCEFLFNGYKKPYSAFEAVGLGFNPFDKDLEPITKGFSSKNTVEQIPLVTRDGGILSWAHPIVTPDKIVDDFFVFLKEHGIEYVEGFYQYSKWDKEYVESIKPELDTMIEKYGMKSTGGTDSHVKSIF